MGKYWLLRVIYSVKINNQNFMREVIWSEIVQSARCQSITKV